MAYEAIVTKLKNVRKHPNADRLQLATVEGYQIIMDLTHKEGELGIFYISDGVLSHKHLMANNLYRTNPETGEAGGGLFEHNRRIKSIKLRGEISNGYWEPISHLIWTGINLSDLKEGQTFSELNGKKVCSKYYTEATEAILNKQKTKKIRPFYESGMFHKHFDTQQVRHNIRRIPEDSVIWITEKMQGTSGRTGFVRIKKPGFLPAIISKTKDYVTQLIEDKTDLNNFISKIKKNEKFRIVRKYNRLYLKSFLDKASDKISKLSKLNDVGAKFVWEYISGSRNIVFDPYQKNIESQYRKVIHNQISKAGLYKGETIYYEIVGYTESGNPIQGHHSFDENYTSDNKLKKEIRSMADRFGRDMIYSYGTDPNDPQNRYNFYVYRITMTNESGDTIDLSWSQLLKRCKALGLKPVSLISGPLRFNREDLIKELGADHNLCNDYSVQDLLLKICENQADLPSTFDHRHIREGLVVRIEHEKMFTILKYKGFWFDFLEGSKKNNKNFVDPEDIG